ncbi:MAG: heme ABC exporter ATP-binding protein CcmA [Gemmatimonadaceae bacterium]
MSASPAPSTIAVDKAPAVEAETLTRTFGSREAVSGVTFRLNAGECLAVFGPNGAGKTTLLRVLASLIRPTGGAVRLAGMRLPGGSEARRLVGFISHESLLYGALTARENVIFAARLYGMARPQQAADAALASMGILDRGGTPVRALSRGLRQRVSVARAIVHGPRILLLDEPFAGLDDAGAAVLSGVLSTLRQKGATLALVTHNLAEGLSLATHVAIMKAGRFLRLDERSSLDVPEYAKLYRNAVSRGS